MTDSLEAAGPLGGAYRLGSHTVPRLGYGAMQLDRHRSDRKRAIAVLRRAIELGASHIDTAQFYGNGFVNDVIREVLSGDDPILVVSKVGAEPAPQARIPLRPAQRPQQLRESVEANLVSLGIEHIPVLNLRRLDARPSLPASGEQIVDLDDQLAVMIALRDEGKIGAIGLSGVEINGLRRALPAGIACVQNAYSLVDRQFEPMLELCLTEGIAWVPFFPLGSGLPGLPKVTEQAAVIETAARLGMTPAQVGLSWLLERAPNTLLIPGTASIRHLEENMAAGGKELDEAARLALKELAVPGAPGPNWQPGEA